MAQSVRDWKKVLRVRNESGRYDPIGMVVLQTSDDGIAWRVAIQHERQGEHESFLLSVTERRQADREEHETVLAIGGHPAKKKGKG